MELEIATSCSTLPGWSKTGRRTRTARAHHQMQKGSSGVASDDEARGFAILESDDFVIESLPPKKRKLESCCEMLPIMKDRKQHRCNVCGRCFSSYQALGGHKAHHNSKHQKALAAAPAGILVNDDDAVVVSGGPPGEGGEHRCTFCRKVFSKGQALGGHRRHCQRPMAENGERMFSFDLNEVPPEWFDW